MANQCLLRVIFSDNMGRIFLVHTMIPAVTAWKLFIVKENIRLNKKLGLFNLEFSVQSSTCRA